ncbi:hypothetical protein D4764_15G0010430 [Takifugu flavidus]|uniref:Uncharacterized protein n=1 Tax=Takifugu flavidus TaxID=433684 RepID=A0A5C6P3Z9_9TELE|nr:hypothetical protein D4764_15G0010430 [Takifugu flavidus]
MPLEVEKRFDADPGGTAVQKMGVAN